MTAPLIPMMPALSTAALPEPAPVSPQERAAKRKELLTHVDLALRQFPERAKDADEAVAEQTNGQYTTVGQLRAAVEGGEDPIRGPLRSGVQGMLADFGDEAAGVGTFLVPGGRGYLEGRDQFQAAEQAYRDLNPGKAFAANATGGLVSGAALMGLRAPASAEKVWSGLASKVVPRKIADRMKAEAIAKAAAAVEGRAVPNAFTTGARVVGGGALAGGLQGAGMADSPPGEIAPFMDVAAQTGIGATIGGGFGLGANMLLRGGPLALSALAGKTGEKKARRYFMDRLVTAIDQAGGPEDVEKAYMARADLEPDLAVLADANPMPGIKGPLHAAADWAVTVAPEVSQKQLPFIIRRAKEEASRVTKALLTGTGRTASQVDAIEAAETLLKQRAKEFSGDTGLYQMIGEAHPSVPYPKNGALTFKGKPTPEGWFHYAAGEDALKGYQTSWLNRQPSFLELQDARRTIQRAIEKATAEGGEVTHLIKLKEQFTRDLEEAVPEFADAQRRYAATSQQIDAIAAGRKAVRAGTEVESAVVDRELRALKPKERDAYKLGMIHEYLRKIKDDKVTHATANRIFNDLGDTSAEKLRRVFRSTADLEAFMKKMEVESDFNLTKQVGGNSQTAMRQQMTGAVEDEMAIPRAAATGLIMGGPKGAVMTPLLPMMHEGKKLADEKVGALLGEALLTPGVEANLARLRSSIKHKQGRIADQVLRQEGHYPGAIGGRAASMPILQWLNDENNYEKNQR